VRGDDFDAFRNIPWLHRPVPQVHAPLIMSAAGVPRTQYLIPAKRAWLRVLEMRRERSDNFEASGFLGEIRHPMIG